MSGADDRPILRVVAGGDPTPEELTALVVALSARQRVGEILPISAPAWSDRSRLLRQPLARGPVAWRWSLR
ncbi:MAG TPA: acyl-CoA carboxylase subunit epsilon [Mycobacteriales bacterium]|nr:acyl-CoA carboxylase subunit epsilon [Mycobacteriales bacterium]